MYTDRDVLIVSKHPELGRLVDYWLRSKNALLPLDGAAALKFAGCKRRDRVFREELRGKLVVGCLPLHLAACAEAVIEPILHVSADLRGQVLTFDQLKQCCEGIQVFLVHSQRIA